MSNKDEGKSANCEHKDNEEVKEKNRSHDRKY